ncbi:peptidyl-trna hydrolase domain protein [Colletotrichum truncatum]|uniref:Peptidyl-trna hydrolase domain protein n=1 Tax=Colletotrichum truncatum TaxID=5467 RepID=A0ACC3ZII7_COLTU|nr:peptidyl-trna hydrolase domain protein [Colletotrichum truncatum]KAF6791756.1 peptidyl-trna hydrolase domain protein [Colletotrichum truncatum]
MPPPLSLARLLSPLLLGARNANAYGFMRGGSLYPRRTALVACFSASPTIALKKHEMPPRPKPPPDSEIEESYLKGSGPGGQKINKTSSAVQLKHIPTGIVVKSQATRSRSQNRKIAREVLAQKLDDLRNGDQSRSAIVGEEKRKKAASAAKKSKRKYRKLEEENAGKAGSENDSGAVEAEVEIAHQSAEEQTTNTPNTDAKP